MILAVEVLEEKEESYRIRLEPEGKRTGVMTHEEKRLERGKHTEPDERTRPGAGRGIQS